MTLKRSPLRRTEWKRTPKAAGAQKNPLSAQRKRKAADDAVYRSERDKRLVRARGRCEFEVETLPGGEAYGRRCPEPATDGHHVVRRSNSGRADHDVENLRVLCHHHHIDVIHANVAWAKSVGYIATAWRKIGESEEVA